MEPLQLRKLRAELNKTLQSRRTTSEIKQDGEAFQELYGDSIWGCKCKGDETFADLYNSHLGREKDLEVWRQDEKDKADNILSLLQGCRAPDWYSLKEFVERRPDLLDRSDVMDALEERREYLEIPPEEE